MAKEKRKTAVILGAGITGLASAYYLSENYDVTIIEKENFIGGSASGFKYKDFILDFGPHKIYTELPGILAEMEKICHLLKIKKKNSIYINRNYYDFPLEISQIASKMPLKAFQAGLDIFSGLISKKRPDDSYENFLINRFGKTLYNLSFKDYAFKVWNSDPNNLDSELAKRRVAISGIFQLIKSVLLKQNKSISAEYFFYPEKGMIYFLNMLKKKLEGKGVKILLNQEIKEIKINENKILSIRLKKTTISKPDYVISTIPLDSLLQLVKSNISFNLTGKIRYQDLNILYFLLDKPRALNDCWVFFPEKEVIFQRVSEQKAFSPFTCPKDKTAIMVETTKELNSKLIDEITYQLEKVNILKKYQITEFFSRKIEKAYPIYKKGFLQELNKTEKFFESIDNFYLLGRQGLFNYNNMDQCWDMAIKISGQIKNQKTKSDWQKTKKYFDSYRIVD